MGADYSIANLLELDDVVTSVEGIEGRFARQRIESRDLGVSHFRYGPGVRGKAHVHREQEEAYVVVSGSGRILLGDEVRDLRPWDVVRVAPQVPRAFEGGPDGLDFIAIGGPKPEGGDGAASDASWPDEREG